MFETIRKPSEHLRPGAPLPTIDPAQIGGLVAPLERDDVKSAVLPNDAWLIAAWFYLPLHQARIFMGRPALLAALAEAAAGTVIPRSSRHRQ